MDSARFNAVVERYPDLRIAVLGDFCLDRYLEIDPARQETSLETGLPVHNVVNVRAQPGGAGTIVNNLVCLTFAIPTFSHLKTSTYSFSIWYLSTGLGRCPENGISTTSSNFKLVTSGISGIARSFDLEIGRIHSPVLGHIPATHLPPGRHEFASTINFVIFVFKCPFINDEFPRPAIWISSIPPPTSGGNGQALLHCKEGKIYQVPSVSKHSQSSAH